MLFIDQYQLHSNLVLAPMAGITDYPFRQLCRTFGAGLATTEMITSNTKLWRSKKSSTRFVRYDELSPRSVQIAGTEPALMAEAAQQSVKLGAQIIDINMGCPAKKVCRKAAGSALMRDERLVEKILQAVIIAVDVPVTLKMRTGWSVDNRNAVNIAQIAQQSGISALAIHGRTKEDVYKGFAEYETIRQVKNAVNIPVIANGDVKSEQDLDFILDYTAADGLMIGRMSYGQPWIFKRLCHYLANRNLATSEPLVMPTFAEKIDIILGHIQAIHRLYGANAGVRIARKHIGWYLDRLLLHHQYKKRIFAITSSNKQLILLKTTLRQQMSE